MTVKKIGFKIVSAVMIMAIMFSICATTISAAASSADNQPAVNVTADKDRLIYVSLGDSMTNGYGLDGYNGESGIMNYGINTYANKFAAWLAGYEGEIRDDQFIFEGSRGTVDHRQLAMSGMRAEDLHWLLELDYKSDAPYNAAYSYNNGGNPGWGDKQANIMDKPLYNQWFEWYTPKEEGGFGFTAGDYRTYADLVDPEYRLADGVAKMLSLYGYNSDEYFNSDYDTEAMVNAAKNGLAANEYYPDNGTHVNEMGYSEENKTALWLQIAGEFYQESIADADIITLALGNTNFGTFLFQYIRWSFENDAYEFDNRYNIEDAYKIIDFNPKLEAAIRSLMDNEVNDLIDKFFSAEAVGERCATEINYIIKYCVLSYLVNYIGALERILELNPDVTLVQVALMNAYATSDPAQVVEGTNFADLIDMLYTPVNAFIAALPTYMQLSDNPIYKDATFIYADTGLVETLSETFGDNFYEVDGQIIDYPGLELADNIAPAKSLVRERFRFWIAGDYGEDRSKQYYDGGGISYGEIWKGLLKNYVNTASEGDFFGTYDLMYVTDGDLVNYVNMSKADFEAKLTGADKTERDWAFSVLMYLAFEHALIEAGQGSLSVESLGKMSGIGPEQFGDAIDAFCDKLGIDSMSSAPAGGIASVDIMKFPQYLSETLLADSTAVSLLALCSRMQVGTGIGGHPSEGGHDTMYEAIRDAYKNGYTAQHQTVKNLLVAADMLLQYVKENYEEIYELVYGKLDDFGYVELSLSYLAELEGAVATLAEELGALEVDSEYASLVSNLSAELANVAVTIADLRVVLEQPTHSGAVAELYDLIANLEAHADDIAAICEDLSVIAKNHINEHYDEIVEKIEETIDAINDFIYENYINIDVELDESSDFVAIGNANAVEADSHYASLVADYLEIKAEILGDSGLRIGDLRAILDESYETDEYGKAVLENIDAEAYLEAIAGAEVISVSFGVEDFTSFAMSQIFGYLCERYGEGISSLTEEYLGLKLDDCRSYEMNWNGFGELIDADKAAEVFDSIYNALVECGAPTALEVSEDLTIDVADIATYAIECYAYAAISYVYNYQATIDSLQRLNPTAEIIILGAFNVFDGFVVAFGDFAIDIGEITKAFAASMDLHTLAYVANNPKTHYVHIGGADTVAEYDGIVNLFDYIVMDYDADTIGLNTDAFSASEDGHAYIADQILTAFDPNYTGSKPCQHVFDGCEDTECNECGFIREAGEHAFSNCTDKTCYKCSYVREPGVHSYDGCLDTDCNKCNYKRVGAHTYAHQCAEECLVCGARRTTHHSFGDWTVTAEASNKRDGAKQRVCGICGAVEKVVIPAFVEELSGGAVAGIVGGSVVVAGAGGFSVFWFFVKKKSFTDLIGVFTAPKG